MGLSVTTKEFMQSYLYSFLKFNTMGLFNREKGVRSENIPRLPSLPDISAYDELPELPQLPPQNFQKKFEAQPLPSFPKNQFGDSLGIQAIKSSINSENMGSFSSSDRRAIEFPEKSILSNQDVQETLNQSSFSSSGKEPVFVKLDRFQESVRKFHEIKEKVGKMEETLRDIRMTREKEENEMKNWETEVQLIKEKVKIIESSLFRKI